MNTSHTFILVVYYLRRPAACPTWISEERPPDALSGPVGATRDCACDKRSGKKKARAEIFSIARLPLEYVELYLLWVRVNSFSSTVPL